jgi:raffinose/stachyose/melibiose transport system substrate-binding protein
MSVRKLVLTLFALALITGLIAACAAPTPTAAPTAQATAVPATAVPATSVPATDTPIPPTATAAPTATNAPVTLSYLVSQGWAPDAEIALAKQFAQKTGITIDYQVIPADQYYNVLKTKLASGEGPDIFGGQSGKTDLEVNYDVEKNAVDLSDQPWVKQEDPMVLDQATVNGKVYGLTNWQNADAGAWVIDYNKDIFSKLNLSVPTTYADFKAACLKIKATGVTPIYEPMADGWHQTLWFAELGVQIEKVTPGMADKLNANQTTFAQNPTALLLLQQFKDLYDSGCFGDNSLSDTYANTAAAIATGKAAMVVDGVGFPQKVQGAYPQYDINNIGLMLMPLADNQVLNLNPGAPTKFIWSGSKHIAEAEQYFDFLTQTANLQYLLDNYASFTEMSFAGTKGKLLPSQTAFLDAHPDRGVVYQTAVKYVNPQWMDMGKDIVAMVTGAETPQQVLANIDKRRADEAKAAGDPNWK